MVAVLVGDDVLGGEIAGGPELALQLLQELQVEVHEPVGRAVEGTELGAGLATAGVRRRREEDRVRLPVLLVEGRRKRADPVLRHVIGGAAQDLFDLRHAVGLACGRHLRSDVTAPDLLLAAAEQLGQEQRGHRDDQGHDPAARLHWEAEPTASHAGERHASATTLAATVLDAAGFSAADLGHAATLRRRPDGPVGPSGRL